MSDYQDNQPAQQGGLSTQHVVESASGTTSPDNSNSGPASYVIFIVGIAVLALLLSTVLGFLAAIMPYVMQEIGSSVNGTSSNTGTGYSTPYSTPTSTQDTNSLTGQTSSSQTLTLSEALDLSLAPYTSLVDDEVSASDYSGADSAVSQCVRDVINADKGSATSVARDLNAAARDDSTASEHIDSAISTCDQAISDLQAITVPASASSSVRTSLDEGISDSEQRWTCIKEELTLLASGDDISYNDLSSFDAEVWTQTEAAGSSLTQALKTSASE